MDPAAQAYIDREIQRLRAEIVARRFTLLHAQSHRLGGGDPLIIGGGPPTGNAGGDLSGTYPNPSVKPIFVRVDGTSALTGTWTQSGAFDINSSGKIKGTALSASGLTGAVAASRYVGATASGAPVSGTFAVGDFIIDQTGKIYVCTVAGTPGTWVAIGGGGATTEHHTLVPVLDNTVAASTTVPYVVVGPLAAAATITAVEAIAGSNVTCGATSAIVDIHQVLNANKNTDGQGTTIFTTQANRPTITNGNRLSSTTLPDVTALAAGDLLLVYLDQNGTSLVDITVGVRVTFP